MARNLSCSAYSFLCFVFLVSFVPEPSLASDELLSSTPGLPTVTVRGFLNFRTTVDNTVIVFTSAASEVPQVQPTFSAVESDTFATKGVQSRDELLHADGATFPQNSLDDIQTRAPEINILENKIQDPFLPHISDNAVLMSANELDKKVKSSQNPYPTGLVTVLDGGTVVEGVGTTVFETKVIGTYIDGKYAQILQSTSHTVDAPPATDTHSYFPTKRAENSEVSNSIVKEIQKATIKEDFFPTSQANATKDVNQASVFKKFKEPTPVPTEEIIATAITTSLNEKSSLGTTPSSSSATNRRLTSEVSPKSSERTSSPTYLQSSFASPSSVLRDVDYRKETLQESMTRKTPTLTSVPSIRVTASEDASRSRKRFLPPPQRPSQTVRLNRFKVRLTLRQNETSFDDEMEELAPKEEEEDHVMRETTSLSVDPAKVVFQETTITSEVTLHVGRRKSIRTLTITTSIPLTVNPTDIQDMLASQSTAKNDERHILTKTFTTTESTMKTSIVPIFDGKSTMYHTVTESFFIMKIITAFRTLPSGNPTIFESYFDESQPTLTLDAHEMQPSTQTVMASEQLAEDDTQETTATLLLNTQPQTTLPLLSFGHALSNNPLAAVYLGLQQLNAQITMYSTVTDLSTYVTTETIYNTKSIRFYDGRTTRHRKISEPVSTTKRTITKTVTSVQPYLNTHAVQQQQQLQQLIAATQTQFNTVTSTYTTVTTATSLSTRIYTLIYNGFSTKYRTITSSSLYPTTVTLTTLLVSPTQVNVPFGYPYTPLST